MICSAQDQSAEPIRFLCCLVEISLEVEILFSVHAENIFDIPALSLHWIFLDHNLTQFFSLQNKRFFLNRSTFQRNRFHSARLDQQEFLQIAR